jgi:hypothetical protein
MQGHVRRIRDLIRQYLNVEAGSQTVVDIKPFERDQRWTYMLGYCQKDLCAPHYTFARHNVSDEELVRGRSDYLAISVMKRHNQSYITRENMLPSLVQYWVTFLSPVFFAPEVVVYYMIKSRRFVPDPKFLVPTSARGFNAEHVQAYLACACDQDQGQGQGPGPRRRNRRHRSLSVCIWGWRTAIISACKIAVASIPCRHPGIEQGSNLKPCEC